MCSPNLLRIDLIWYLSIVSERVCSSHWYLLSISFSQGRNCAAYRPRIKGTDVGPQPPVPIFTTILSSPPQLPLGMTAPVIHTSQLSAGKLQHTRGYSPVSPPPTPLSATLVNTPQHSARPSVKLKITRGQSDIANSVVVDAAGQSLYSISSNSKRTTVVACKNNVEVASVEWDRSSPRMVFHRKKMKCKEWLPLVAPETEYKRTPLTCGCRSEICNATCQVSCIHTW